MKHSAAIALAVSALWANAGHSAELRGVLGVSTGGVTYTDDYGNELTANLRSRSLAFEYYPDESGPFIGAAIADSDADDYKVNGSSISGASVDATNTTVLVGYRGGSLGTPQPYGAVTLVRSDADGETSRATGLHGGVERTSDTGRVTFGLSYLDEEDFNTVGASITGVAFVSDTFGISVTAGTSRGSGELAGIDFDGTSWRIGLGLEFRN